MDNNIEIKKEEKLKLKQKRAIINYSKFLYNYFIKELDFDKNEIIRISLRLSPELVTKDGADFFRLFCYIKRGLSERVMSIEIEPIKSLGNKKYKEKYELMGEILVDFLSVLDTNGFEMNPNKISEDIVKSFIKDEIVLKNKNYNKSNYHKKN